ncbi:MAG TPA: hypothetical protein VIF83_11965 [Gemmatimonadaceae bacterium]
MNTPRVLSTFAGAVVVTAVLIPATVRAQEPRYSAPRNAAVPAAGVRLVRISGAAGFLHVDGRTGIGQVRVNGTARSSNRSVLDRIRLIAERQGDVIVIKADMPDDDRGVWDLIHRDWVRILDMDVEVPANIPVEVHDGSGELSIRGTASADVEDGSGNLEMSGIGGNVDVVDGSGEIKIDGVEGDVQVRDGSGNINVSNVTGRFLVDADGSGNIDANGVGGTMRVSSDGSGNISARRVGGDLVVGSKGSGDIQYSTVKGSVDIPERHRRYRRGDNF